jgi:predicted Holliday junction resolvase-like endonuclease
MMMSGGFDLATGLSILVSIMLVVVLYHILFIVVDVRKIVRRVEGITDELETVLLKPISLTDKALQWAMHTVEGQTKKATSKMSKKSSKKSKS